MILSNIGDCLSYLMCHIDAFSFRCSVIFFSGLHLFPFSATHDFYPCTSHSTTTRRVKPPTSTFRSPLPPTILSRYRCEDVFNTRFRFPFASFLMTCPIIDFTACIVSNVSHQLVSLPVPPLDISHHLMNHPFSNFTVLAIRSPLFLFILQSPVFNHTNHHSHTQPLFLVSNI